MAVFCLWYSGYIITAYRMAAPCVDEHGMRVDRVAACCGDGHNTTVGDASCHHMLRVVLHVLHSQHVF